MATKAQKWAAIRANFVPFNRVTGEGDFVAQDDSDGEGPYIRDWKSATPCPYPELIREPKPPAE